MAANSVAGSLGFYTSGLCRRYNRWKYKTLVTSTWAAATADSKDYNCFWASPNTDPSQPVNIVGINTAETNVQQTGGSGYTYPFGAYFPNLFDPDGTLPKVNVGGSSKFRADFGGAYSNTVDSNSIYPTVFNYNGLLPYVKEINLGGTSWPATLTKFSNNLLNCDLFYLYNTGERRLGAAFSTAITGSSIVTRATNTINVVTCLRCAFGYMLSYVPGNTKATNFPMPSCVTMGSTCAAPGVVFGGLPTHLNTFLSCHLCANPSSSAYMYPSIWMEVDAASSPASEIGRAHV